MLHEMGVETGVDLPRLIEASRAAQEVLGRPLGAHVLRRPSRPGGFGDGNRHGDSGRSSPWHRRGRYV